MVQKCKPVIFIDLDNTILDGPFETAVFPRITDELSLKSGLRVEEVRKKIVDENFSRVKNSSINPSLAMDWDDIVMKVASSLDISISSTFVIEIFMEHLFPPYIKLHENSLEVIKILNTNQRHLVAATKGLAKYQLPLLEALGISKIFEEVLTPDTNSALKNDVRFYGEWTKRTSKQITVGDHILDDVFFPKKFGFSTIWRLDNLSGPLKALDPFRRSKFYNFPLDFKYKPDAIIVDLKELPKSIEYLETHNSVN